MSEIFWMLLLPGLLAWYAFWALVRDQDGPWLKKPEGAGSNKWKEVGIGAIGLPASALLGVRYGWEWGILVYVTHLVAWALAHDILDYVRPAVWWVQSLYLRLRKKPIPPRPPSRGNAIGIFWSPGRNGVLNPGEALLNLALGGTLVMSGVFLCLLAQGAWLEAAYALASGAAKAAAYLFGWLFVREHATLVGHVGHGALLGLGLWSVL